MPPAKFAYVRFINACRNSDGKKHPSTKIIPVEFIRHFDETKAINRVFQVDCGNARCTAVVGTLGDTMQDLELKLDGKRTRFVPSKIAKAPSNISSSDDSVVKPKRNKMNRPVAVTPEAKAKKSVAAVKIFDNKQRTMKEEPVRSSKPKTVEQSKPAVRSSKPKNVEQSTPTVRSSKPKNVEQSTPTVRSSKPKKVEQSTPVVRSSKPKTVALIPTSKTGSQTMRSSQTAIAPMSSAVALKSKSAKKAKNNEVAISQEFEKRASSKVSSEIQSAENEYAAPSPKGRVRNSSQPARVPRSRPLTEVQINKAEESYKSSQSYHSKVIESLRAGAANKSTKKWNTYEESKELKTKHTLIKPGELKPSTEPKKLLGGKDVNDDGGQLVTQQENQDSYTAEVDDSQEEHKRDSQARRIMPAS